jgi:hypothetical protein
MRIISAVLLCGLIITFLTCKPNKHSEMRDMQCFRIDTRTYETLELPYNYMPGDTIIYGHFGGRTTNPYSATYVVISAVVEPFF